MSFSIPPLPRSLSKTGVLSTLWPPPGKPRGRSPQRPYPDGTYILTTFGGPDDEQPTACGTFADGTTYYATGVYGWGCDAKIMIRNGDRCVIATVLDNGPATWVEDNARKYCGLGRILDVSPLVAGELFERMALGWSDCQEVEVRRVEDDLPEGPCTLRPTGIADQLEELAPSTGEQPLSQEEPAAGAEPGNEAIEVIGIYEEEYPGESEPPPGEEAPTEEELYPSSSEPAAEELEEGEAETEAEEAAAIPESDEDPGLLEPQDNTEETLEETQPEGTPEVDQDQPAETGEEAPPEDDGEAAE